MEKVEGGAPDKVKSSVARSVCVVLYEGIRVRFLTEESDFGAFL
jgi:hypothetical protein